MRTPTAPLFLVAALAAPATAQNPNRVTTSYTDPLTSITFQSFTTTTGYRFGLVLPPSSSSADPIIQLISPLSASGAGWAAIDFGASMVGPLQIAAWPKGDAAKSVMIAPRVSTGYRTDDTKPYTASAITLTPIAKGTLVNSTHLTATFVCGGCAGRKESFDPSSASTAQFSYAYSLVAVDEPGSADTRLSDHTSLGELYGAFGVDIAAARSSDYAKFAELASAGGEQPKPTGTEGSAPPAGTSAAAGAGAGAGGGGHGSEAFDPDYNKLSAGAVVALAFAGVLYVLQAFSVF